MRQIYPPQFLLFLRLAAFLSLSAISLFAQSKATVRISGEKTVDGERIVLADIAEIKAEAATVQRLRSISLGYAPNVGMTREISRSQIALAISAAGFADGEIVLDAPAKILIRREGQTVLQSQMREAVEKAVAERISNEQISAKITRLELPADFLAPKGSLEIRPNASANTNFFQPFSLPVEIRVDGKTWRRFSARVEIEAYAEILVAARDLAANSKLAETDVRFENRRLTKPLTNYLREMDKLRGLTLVKNIANGAEMTSDSFVSGVVVKAGDAVRIEAQSEKLKIVVSGEARASGRIGDRIAVKNLQSGAILQALVADEGLVRINF